MKKIRRGFSKPKLFLLTLGLVALISGVTITLLNRYSTPPTNSIPTETTHYTTWYGLKRPVDTTLRKSGGDYQFSNNTNTFRSAFKSNPFTSEAIRFSYLGSTIQFHTPAEQDFGLLTANTPSTNGNIITYPQVIENLNLRYTIEPTRLLEEFVVYDASTAAKVNRLSQQATTTNISRYEVVNDAIYFYQQRFNRERLILTLPRPVIYELGNRDNFTHGIKYEINENSPGSYTITKVITPEGAAWLSEPARVYPIAIDLVIDNADTASNWVSSDPTNTTVTQETTIKQEGTGSVKVQTVGYSTTSIELSEYTNDANAQAAYVTTGNPSATGGTVTTAGGYTVHTFTSSGTLGVTGTLPVDSLVVGGGANGGGGGAGSNGGTGGGGGEVKSQSGTLTTQSYPITVGGVAQSSSFNGVSSSGATNGTSGNGHTAGSCYVAYSSYSCGGGGGDAQNGSSSPGGEPPNPGGSGGSGTASSISGSSIVYGSGGGGGGGGGGNDYTQSGGSGGSGAGLGGYCSGGYGAEGAAAVANRGGGGGGGGACNQRAYAGGAGAAGVVIVRYPTPPYLQTYSEATVKTEGTYSLKGIATQTSSLNRTLTRTLGSPVNLTNGSFVTFDLRSSRTGSNLKIGLHDSGGVTTEITPNITSANQFQTISLDLTGVSDANKDAIDQIIITVLNADAANTFYLDNMIGTIGLSYQDTVTRTVSPTNLSANTGISFWVRSSVAGTYAQFETGESASNEITSSFTINAPNTWEQKVMDLTGVSSNARDAITKYAVRFTGNTSGAAFYLDDIQTLTVPAAPTIQAATALSTSSIRWNFTDNSTNELGFKVYDSALSATTLDLMEYSSDSNAYTSYITNSTPIATGGTTSFVNGYTLHSFTSPGSSTFTPGTTMNVEALVVAGGAGGGGGHSGAGTGGGGGGGLVAYNSAYNVTGATTVTVGSGGTFGECAGVDGCPNAAGSPTAGGNGGNSAFGAVTAVGGGGGALSWGAGLNGGTGGGGSAQAAGGTGTYNGGAGGNCNSPCTGGGGGGAGAHGYSGASGSHGGNGVTNSITGTSLYYGGGGGGHGYQVQGPGNGGLGGGGLGGGYYGATYVERSGVSGTANTGGGGGGGGRNGRGGSGGSGVVYVKYATPLVALTENTIKTEGSYALKVYAGSSASANKTLTRTIGAPINLTGKIYWTFDMRSNRTGSNIKIGIRDSGGTITETTPNITSAGVFQNISVDLSGVSDANKDAIDRIIITILDAGSDNTFYLDNMKGSSVVAGPTCATPNISSCDETGLATNTQYTRKVAAYNTEGESAYSGNTSRYTLAEVPPAPAATNRTSTSVQINPGAGSNPAATTYAIYRETNTNICDGSGGVYLAANGSSNGATAVWQTEAAWATVTATGLTANTAYVFCVKAKNGDGVETAFSDIGAYDATYVPFAGDFVCTTDNNLQSNSFTNRYPDGNSPGRYVIGVDTGSDDGVSSVNTATFEAKSCVMTINSTDTLVAGTVKLTGGSIAIADGATIEVGKPIWVVDADGDGYTSDSKVYVGPKPLGGRRKNLVTNIGTNDCNESSNTTFQSATLYVDTDGDGYGAGAPQSVCTSGSTPAGYSTNNSDCYNNNANAKPGSTVCSTTHRGDGSFDFNCSGGNSTCGTTRYNGNTYSNYCRDEGTCGTNKFGDPKCCLCGSVTIISTGVGCGASGYNAATYGTWQTQAGCVGPVSGTYASGSGIQGCQ